MKADIITIGDEILIGQIVDTNSAWISKALNDIGVTVRFNCSIGDSSDQIKERIEASFQSSDIIIVTGGLGPTKDDITKKCLSEIFDTPMVVDQNTFDHVQKMLSQRGIDMNDLNKHQADVPKCCKVLYNENGTAPGMWFERESKVLVSLPGVPFEMKTIFSNEVIPLIKSRFKLNSCVHKTVITFGLAESILAQTIENWEDNLPKQIKLAYLPNPNGVRLRLSAYEVEEGEATKQIESLFAQLKQIIPQYFIGFEDADASVQHDVANLLTLKNSTLSVAESCTGGTIASRFTAMAGASEYFIGSITSYSNDMKVNILGVNRSDINKYGAVSEQVAHQMAEGVRRITGSDYSIATTGIAGPTGGTPDKPVGTVWIAIATPEGTFAKKMIYGNLRQQNIDRSSAAAIYMLRSHLIGYQESKITGGVL